MAHHSCPGRRPGNDAYCEWTRISAEGSNESGNGWLKSSEGKWSFNEGYQTFSPIETNGLYDPYGAFLVSVDSDEMTWQRAVDGTSIVVSLTQIDHYIPVNQSTYAGQTGCVLNLTWPLFALLKFVV